MLVIAAITWGQFLQAHYGRKHPICRWNFDLNCHSSRDIFGLDSHIAISDYQSLSQSLGNTFIKLTMVDNPRLANCHNYGDISISGFSSHFWLLSLLELPRYIFSELAVVKNPRFVVGIFMISVILLNI